MSALPVISLPELWKGTGDQRNDKWNVARLIALSKDLPVFEATMAAIATDYTLTDSADLRDFAAHMRKVLEADLSYPIILAPNGVIMDGRHRLTKALLEGRTTIKAVRFDQMPAPDGDSGE